MCIRDRIRLGASVLPDPKSLARAPENRRRPSSHSVARNAAARPVMPAAFHPGPARCRPRPAGMDGCLVFWINEMMFCRAGVIDLSETPSLCLALYRAGALAAALAPAPVYNSEKGRVTFVMPDPERCGFRTRKSVGVFVSETHGTVSGSRRVLILSAALTPFQAPTAVDGERGRGSMRQAASPSRFRMDRHELFILQRKQSSFRLRLSIELRPQGDRRTC